MREKLTGWLVLVLMAEGVILLTMLLALAVVRFVER